jgi:hypothetical protein
MSQRLSSAAFPFCKEFLPVFQHPHFVDQCRSFSFVNSRSNSFSIMTPSQQSKEPFPLYYTYVMVQVDRRSALQELADVGDEQGVLELNALESKLYPALIHGVSALLFVQLPFKVDRTSISFLGLSCPQTRGTRHRLSCPLPLARTFRAVLKRWSGK